MDIESEIQSEMRFRRLVAGTLLEISELVSELAISVRNEQGNREIAVVKHGEWEELISNNAELKHAADDLADSLRRYKAIERRIVEAEGKRLHE